MKEALGLVEIYGLSAAVLVADAMVKTASVTLHEIENTKGNGYMTIKIFGDVGAVNASVMAGKQLALENNKFISSKVIPRPSTSVEKLFCTPPKEGKAMPASAEDKKTVALEADKEITIPKGDEENHAPEGKVEEPVTDTSPYIQDNKVINTSSKSSKTSKHKTERNKPE